LFEGTHLVPGHELLLTGAAPGAMGKEDKGVLGLKKEMKNSLSQTVPNPKSLPALPRSE